MNADGLSVTGDVEVTQSLHAAVVSSIVLCGEDMATRTTYSAGTAIVDTGVLSSAPGVYELYVIKKCVIGI